MTCSISRIYLFLLLIGSTGLFATTFHQKGEGVGKEFLEAIEKMTDPGQNILHNEKYSPLQDPDVHKMQSIIASSKPSSKEYQQAFKDMKSFYTGLKKALSSYKPLPETDRRNQAKNMLVRFMIDLAEAVINAKDQAEVLRNIGEVIARLAEKSKDLRPTVPQRIDFTPDTDDPFYQAGLKLSEHSNALFIKEAQGAEISQKDMAVSSQEIHKTFSQVQVQQDPHGYTLKMLNYLSGMEDGLKTFDLEAVLINSKTLPQKAGQLRLKYKLSLQSVASAIAALKDPSEAPQSLSTLAQAMKDMGNSK